MWNLDTIDMTLPEDSRIVANLANLLKYQRFLDTLRLQFSNFEYSRFNFELHPDLKIRRLFIEDPDDIVHILYLTLELGTKVECLSYCGYLAGWVSSLLKKYNKVKALNP